MIITPAIPGRRGLKGGTAHWSYLHPGQMQIYKSKARFRVVTAGRRWGKSKLACVELIAAAASRPKQMCWYVAPTYQMARQIMWQEIQDLTPKKWVARQHDTMMTIWLKNGSVIQLKGADKPDALRGVGLNFVVLDEFQDMKEDTWSKVIRPTLSDKRGRALVIGTPKSFNNLYNLYMKGQDARLRQAGLWESWQLPTITSPFIPKSEIEAARADLDEKTFTQEYEASFNTMSNRVYYAFDRRVHVRRCSFDKTKPLWIGMDFNIDPMSAVFIQPHEKHLEVIGELIIYNSNTAEMAEKLDQLWHRYLRQVIVYPDPAGSQRDHKRGESDFKILKDQGFPRLKYRRQHARVRDRINAVNRLFKAANGDVRLYIDDSCKALIKSLEQTQYKPGTSEVDKRAKHEHESDALGYPLDVEFPVRRNRLAGYSI